MEDLHRRLSLIEKSRDELSLKLAEKENENKIENEREKKGEKEKENEVYESFACDDSDLDINCRLRPDAAINRRQLRVPGARSHPETQ